jgi:hypothetical protein
MPDTFLIARKMRLFHPVQGATMRARKQKKQTARDIRDAGTLQYGDELPACVMLPVRRLANGGLWLPEEATVFYARRVHLNSGLDVARGHVAYYHNGRREKGRGKNYWSLLDEALALCDLSAAGVS